MRDNSLSGGVFQFQISQSFPECGNINVNVVTVFDQHFYVFQTLSLPDQVMQSLIDVVQIIQKVIQFYVLYDFLNGLDSCCVFHDHFMGISFKQ